MADLELARLSALELAEAMASADRAYANLNLRLRETRGLLAAARASGDDDAAAVAREQVEALLVERRDTLVDRARTHDRFADDLVNLLGADIELEGHIPLLLLPVRVECRSTPDLTALRVRIYPDTLHTEHLDEGVTDAERSAGQAYWQTVWADGDPQAPWEGLVAAVGAARAPWVAEVLRPTNLADRPGGVPAFPDPPPATSRLAVARTLPDRFFVRIEQDGAAPVTRSGRLVPAEVPVGLADQADLSVLVRDGEDLPVVDESLAWLVNFKEAERLGMALTIGLPLPNQAVRKLTVYGVRATTEPGEAAARLERLIRSHRFTDGAEFVPQGTPTNNTDSARTSWSRRTPPGPPDLDGADALGSGANAAVTAAALGISADLLATLPNGTDTEQARARAFHTSLWGTTWGDAIETLSPAGRNNGEDRLDNAALDAVRTHWIDHVRGRGPLPALRFGRQPYGVLPIVATDETWKPLGRGFAERSLVPFLDSAVRGMWDAAIGSVVTVLNTALDDALPTILGTDAVLRALRVRSAVSPDPTFQTAASINLPDAAAGESRGQIAKVILLLAGIDPNSLEDAMLVGKETRSLALPLVHESDNAFVANLLEAVPRPAAAKSVLQVLLAHAREVEADSRDRLFRDELVRTLFEAVDSARVEVDRGLVLSALESVAQGQYDDAVVADAARHLDEQVGRLDLGAVAARNPVASMAAPTLIQQVAGVEPRTELLRNGIGMQLVGELFHGSRRAAEFREALKTIAGIESMDERRLLLSETLDCCSHRLDAWLTSAATMRLHDLRARGGKGTHIGAYAWLEDIDLRPAVRAGQVDGVDVLKDGMDGGYIHAPGLIHAATAGVLRSGRLTHRRGDPNNEALDIDLSSTRVRDALALLDGMRQGQSLGALLGYRLERRLHDWPDPAVELDRFIYVLRALAPLRAGKLTAHDQPVEEGLAASQVVDGLRITEVPWPTIDAALVAGPQDNNYIPPGTWVAPRDGEAEAVRLAIEELEQTHDAVADLLLAESVHQIVGGNPPRAAAAMDLLGAGEAAPPDADVVRTPRSGTPIQHRLAVVVSDPPPGPVAGWNPGAPRALAEPRLEIWAQQALGDPAEVEISADGKTLTDAGLSALDVLYDSDGESVEKSTLAARIRLVVESADLSGLASTWEVAGLLRTTLSRGRPVDVADLGRADGKDLVGRVPDAAEIVGRATVAKDGLAAAVATGTAAALTPYGIWPPGANPDVPLAPEEEAVALEALLVGAQQRVLAAEALIARATPAADPPAPKVAAELGVQALGAVFGTGFVTVPVIGAAPAAEPDRWSEAVGPSGVTARVGADIRPWLARAGALRDATSAYGEIVLVREATGTPPLIRVAQSPAAAYSSWIGLPFPDAVPPLVPMQSMVLEQVGADLSGAVAGVVLDEWTEVVPKRLLRGDPANPDEPPELVDVTTTGLAMNANAPGARPPQSLLLAMTPDGRGWSAERLVAVLDEALALARMRCLTLDQIPYAGAYLPALYFNDWSLQGEPTIDWSKVAVEYDEDYVAKFLAVKE